MKLSADMILEENIIPSTVLTRSDMKTESIYTEALRFSNNITEQINESNKIFYKSILEGGDDITCIYEASNSFGETIRNIIDKILDFIKRIFTKFITQINSIVKSDKYIKKRKNDFAKLDTTFEMKIYKFSRLDDSTFPACDIYDTYNRITKDIQFSSGTDTADSTYTLNRVNNVYDNIISDTTDWYDLFRGQVLGKDNTPVSTEDYNKELFEIFRSGDSEPSKETIDLGVVLTCLDRFLNYDKSVKSVSDMRKHIEREYNAIKKSIKSLNMSDTDNAKSLMGDIFTDNTDNVVNNINGYADKDKIIATLTAINKNRVSRIEGMCNIHSLAFAKKLDAIKAAYNQDKRVLYAALKKINKIKNESYLILDEEDNTICESYDYAMFLNKQIQNQNDIVDYIRECVALESGNFAELQAINESAIDTIKAVIQKIIESIRNLFTKFTTGMRNALTTDKTFLADKDNKKIILNKPFKDREITVSDYNTDKLTNGFSVPKFDTNKFQAVMKDPTVKTFIEQHEQNLPGIKPADIELKETILEILCPDPDEINMQSLNKEQIYRFCIGFEDTLKVLENDQNTVGSNQSAMSTELARIKRELESEEAAKATESKGTETTTTDESTIVFSNVYNTYLSEDVSYGKVNDAKGSTGSGTGKSVINTQAKQLGTANSTTIANDAKDSINVDKSGKSKSDLIEQYKTGSNLYFMQCGQILTAKMEACRKIYKDYMSILRRHVKDYAGETATSSSGEVMDDIKETPGIFKDSKGNEHRIEYVKGTRVKDKNGKMLYNDTAVDDVFAEKLDVYTSKCKGYGKDKTNNTVFKLDGNYVSFNSQKDAWVFVDKSNIYKVNKKHSNDDTVTPDSGEEKK